MLNQSEIMQTIQMIDQQHLDVRTITMGISLLSCARSDPKQACDAIYDKITHYAEHLVKTGEPKACSMPGFSASATAIWWLLTTPAMVSGGGRF